MYNRIDGLEEEKDKAVNNERCEVDKAEALDIIATHIMLCAEELKRAGYSIEDFEY